MATRSPTKVLCLTTAALSAWTALALTSASYSPGLLFTVALSAVFLLAIAVVLQLVGQLLIWNINATPFVPSIVLAGSAYVMHEALNRPGLIQATHWKGELAALLPYAMAWVVLPLAALAFLVALTNTARRLPLGFHAFKEGRMYRGDAELIASKVRESQTRGTATANGVENSIESAKPYRAKQPKLNFAALHGNQELKDRLLEAGQEWRDDGKNGVLLFGPPGTGKTAFAEALAGELGLGYIYVTFGDMASKWINETTERLVAIFAAASEQQPVMLFIDELDAVLKDRRQLSAGSSEEYERIVATFLGKATALQGSKVLLVAATNYVDRLDEAAVREGRFDFKIAVPLPDAPARYNLIATRMTAHGCSTDEGTLQRLTRRWAGFNVPRILAGANTACDLAKADGTTELTFDHFYRALRKIQGRKGGAPEGAKSLDQLFLDAGPAQRLREIAAQLSRVDEIEKLGGSVPKGVLFFGPPGTGKTATAMALAHECGWSFIERNGRDLMRDGEIDRLRGEASDLRPAIVFLDEADDILADRSYSGIKSVTNELLTLIDGAGGMLQDVVWIAATNHPEGMDSAALRGGRFEQKVVFGPLGDETLLRMILAWATEHAAELAEEPSIWAAKSFEHLRGQTPANVQSILRLANNMAVAKHVSTGEARAVMVAHVAAAAAEIGH